MRGSPFLKIAALGLLTSLTSVTTSQAGPMPVTTVTTTETLSKNVTIKELDVTYTTAAKPFTDLTSSFVIPSSTTGVLSHTGATVKETFTPPTSAFTGFVTQFTFTVPLSIADAESQVKIKSAFFVTVATPGHPSVHVAPTFQSLNFSNASVVPEPASLAMCGTSLLAGIGLLLRRRVKAAQV